MFIFEGAVELAGKIKRREFSPVEVVNAYIAQIERVNPLINAVVDQRFEAAKKEAQILEKRLMSEMAESLPTFFGVPFTTKELISIEGLSFTCGSIHLKNQKAKHDATVVKRMRAAGAIPIAVTNVPEWGLWFENYNFVYGRTNNPWDTSRTSGGSSGGEGALIASGGSGFGIGSDVGGSIRIPAAFCGIFGHKTSRFAVPYTGHNPVLEENAHLFNIKNYTMSVIGPLSRSAKDLLPLLKTMAGPDGFDRQTQTNMNWNVASHLDWRKKKVYLLSSPRFFSATKTDPEVEKKIVEAAKVFESLGAQIISVEENFFRRGVEVWYDVMHEVVGPSFGEVLTAGTKKSYILEAARTLVGSGHYTLPALFFAIIERYWPFGSRKKSNLMEALRLQNELDRMFQNGDGILLMPPHPRVARKHHAALLMPTDFIYTGIFNALDYPGTSAPCGLSEKSGLPLSTQIVVGRNQDPLSIRAAEILEEAFGGFKIPKLISTVESSRNSDSRLGDFSSQIQSPPPPI